MGAVSALTTAGGTLRRNPIILLGVFFLSVVGSLTTISQVWGGLAAIGAAIVTFLLGPFFTGGVLGMADEAVADRTSLSTLLSEGTSNYVTLLIATIIQIILFGAIGILWAIVMIALVLGGGIALGGIGGGAGGVLGIGVIVGVVLSVLVFVLPLYFLQFYDVAIVASNTSAWGGFKRSFSFVRSHLLSALGYTVIFQAINLLVVIPTLWFTYGMPLSLAELQAGTQQMAGMSTLEGLLPLAAFSIIAGTIASSLLVTYRVAYYTRTTNETSTSAAS